MTLEPAEMRLARRDLRTSWTVHEALPGAGFQVLLNGRTRRGTHYQLHREMDRGNVPCLFPDHFHDSLHGDLSHLSLEHPHRGQVGLDVRTQLDVVEPD